MSKGGLGGRKIIVASEYENLTRRWISAKGVEVSSTVWSEMAACSMRRSASATNQAI